MYRGARRLPMVAVAMDMRRHRRRGHHRRTRDDAARHLASLAIRRLCRPPLATADAHCPTRGQISTHRGRRRSQQTSCSSAHCTRASRRSHAAGARPCSAMAGVLSETRTMRSCATRTAGAHSEHRARPLHCARARRRPITYRGVSSLFGEGKCHACPWTEVSRMSVLDQGDRSIRYRDGRINRRSLEHRLPSSDGR